MLSEMERPLTPTALLVQFSVLANIPAPVARRAEL